MARPQKDNAEYFSHDNDMRNDEKIKAIRSKYWHEWYSIWNMLLEKLCKSSLFKMEYSELNIELWSGDFDMEPDRLKEILEYFLRIKLVILEDNFITSKKLIERLQPMMEKRERMKALAEKRWNKWCDTDDKNGKNDAVRIVSGERIIQSKVKESKVKESKVKISKDISITSSNEEVMMQKFLRQAVWLSKFKDKNEEEIVKQCHELMKEIGKEEFWYRLKTILEEPFKAKNCNKLEFLYGELASFIHSPVVKLKGQGQKVSPNKY